MKPSKSKILLLLVIAIAIAGIYYFITIDNNKLSDEEARDFGIANISEVDKIFLASKSGQSVTLVKTENGWIANSNYNVRSGRIKVLLNTLEKVKVRNRVPKTMEQTVVNNLSSTHIKVEVYSKDQLIKNYFVGGPDRESTGTYMLLVNPETGENAEHPFVTHILGFEGYLTPRYSPNINDWRDLTVFNYPKNEIQSIQLNYPNQPQNGYRIELKEGAYKLTNKSTEIEINNDKLKEYILRFKKLSIEQFITQNNQQLLDSLKKSKPYFTLTVTDLEGSKKELKGFKRKAKPGETNLAGEPIEFDPERFFAIAFDGKELCIAQYFVFDQILKTPEHFR